MPPKIRITSVHHTQDIHIFGAAERVREQVREATDMITDKAGAKIAVGCRVTEVDFSYGDGVVESVTVPVTGGGTNVGVKWDDESLGGPNWSAAGGGRGGEHLLVIEAAPPFAEQAEGGAAITMPEGQRPPRLVEYGDSDDSDEEGEEAVDDGHSVADGSFEAVVREGERIKMLFGRPAQFYGGLVGSFDSAGRRIVGFDDGDLKTFPTEDADCKEGECSLRAQFEAKTLTASAASDGGVIGNETGHAAAAAFVEYKNRTAKVVGLLVGRCGVLCEGMPMYQSFYLAEGAFAQPAAPTRNSHRKPTAANSPAACSVQDRHGLHTFSRGDVVAYQQAKSEEAPMQAVVYACCYLPPTDEPKQQARKVLVLYDQEADMCFLGSWPAWRRVSKQPLAVGGTFDCDDDEQVKTITAAECVRMNDTFGCSLPLATSIAKAVSVADLAPPKIQVLRDRAADAAKKAEREMQQKARREQRERDAAAARNARLPPAKPPPRDPRPPRDPPPPRDPGPPPPRDNPPPCESASPPGSVRLLRKQLRGLRAAQGVERTAAREQQIGELEYDLEERERKYRKYGRW